MDYKTSTEKKVIDTLRLLEGNKDIGFNFSIFKQPNCDKISLNVSVQINVDDKDSTKYIGCIHDFHEKLISEDYEEIRLQSGDYFALLMAHK